MSLALETPITEMTEREVIATILRMYTQNEDAVRNISNHLFTILVRRRSELRKQRGAPGVGERK
jgi:hypothetical protein